MRPRGIPRPRAILVEEPRPDWEAGEGDGVDGDIFDGVEVGEEVPVPLKVFDDS